MESNSNRDNDAENGSSIVDIFNILPEGCIANVLSLTTPADAGRLSLVASTFRSAAGSDAIWEKFLPSDYKDIIARSADNNNALAFPSKKELYLHLCHHPLLIDGCTKSFSLEKLSGKKCYMLAAKDLYIVWVDTPQYWRWTSVVESRFAEVAELIMVCWLEIHGRLHISMLSPETTYAAYLVFKSTGRLSGFINQPAWVSVGINGGERITRTVCLNPEEWLNLRHRRRIVHQENDRIARRENDVQYTKHRGDGWLEIELGEYDNAGGSDGELEMSFKEVTGNWKSGIIVQGIEIRPKGR